jgi:Histidine kinase-, DNA gyrase B-, and HSP90-like ATPase
MTGPTSSNLQSNWKETTLWKLIQENQSSLASSVSRTLNECMPNIQTILEKGGTAATDFTLHDGGHAFRVAERMCQITPDDVLKGLSVYELAFLLLSAYLHDIGMTPELRKVTTHYNFLLTGEPQTLSQDEMSNFQKWLDDDGRGITPPLTKAKATTKDLQVCQETITYYARARHNDWGAEWIRKRLGSCRLGEYQNWIEDIIRLCRSHHFGYNELKDSSFNPVVVNPGGIVVHFRFLACVLRIADILEFDPERTPSVIFSHRDVTPGSRIYWWRDHEVTLVQEGDKLSIHARPSNAQIEHAIRLMVNAINSELQICRMLAEQTHFEICPTLDRPLPHRWSLPTTISTNIVPREGTYEYINGSFRPNTEKLLQLLSGTALYGNPLMAVRELLQNAFDAVREKIAYTRLSQKSPANPQLALQIEGLHTVSLRFEIDDEGCFLVCTDNGIGMTRSIIENHLLVSGTSARHDVLELERRCVKNGFPLGRTGQFGIGVLSYFMIAERVVINTKRSQEPGDSESSGWRFDTAGVGSFGELKKQHSWPPGTQVRLHLRDEVIGQQPVEWFESLHAFIKKTLQHVPCKFELSSSLPGCPTISIGPGWCNGQGDFAKILSSEINRKEHLRPGETPLELLPSVRREEIEAEAKHLEGIRSEALKCLRWKVFEGEIPGGAGRARVQFPYFDLQGNASFGFLRVTKKDCDLIVERLVEGYTFVPSGEIRESWKGMAISPRAIRHNSRRMFAFALGKPGAFIEIDWYSPAAGDIEVNRTHFLANDQSYEYRLWVMQQLEELRSEIARSNMESAFWRLNWRLAGGDAGNGDSIRWLAPEKSDEDGIRRQWEPLKFPLIPRTNFLFGGVPSGKFTWKRTKVSVSSNLQRLFDDKVYSGLTWYSNDSPPDRIVQLEVAYPRSIKLKMQYAFLRGLKLTPIWTGPPKSPPSSHVAGMRSKFPPKWATLCGVQFDSYFSFEEGAHIWNGGHPLVFHLDSEGWDWCAKAFLSSLDPLSQKVELLSTRSRASAWVILCLNAQANELWDGLKDRDPAFLQRLWDVLFPKKEQIKANEKVICQWVEQTSSGSLRILSPSGWLVLKAGEEQDYLAIKKYIPDPGSEWKVILHRQQENKSRKTVV